MIEWILRIHPRPLNTIQSRTKTVEGRVPDPEDCISKYSLMTPGDDYIRFRCTDNSEENIVQERYPIKYVRHYDTIAEMLREEGLKNVLPDVNSVDEGVQRYYSFPDYKQNAQEYGIYAIGLGEPEKASL